MRALCRILALGACCILLFVCVANFANGFFCTRIIGLIIAPIEILILPAAALVLASGALFAAVLVSDLRARRPLEVGVLRQLSFGLLLLLIQFLGFDARLSGLVARAKWSEQDLLHMSRAYREGGDAAARSSSVAKWGVVWDPHFRATPDFVEVSWGSTLPRSWGFRICDRVQPSPTPQYCTNADDIATPATLRVTAFIGLW